MAGQVFCNASVRRTWPGNASAVSNRPAEQFFALTIVSPPQLHLQRQTMLLFSRCSVFSTAVNIPKRQPVKSFSRGMYGSALRSKRFQAVLFAAKQKRNSRASTEEPAFLPVMYSQASNHSRSVKRCGWMADRIRPSCAASTGAHRRSER